MHRKIILLIVAAVVCTSLHAQSNFYKFHALFIYNFTKHIQWPSAGDAFTVGVYGSEKAMNVLNDNIQGRLVGGKAIQIRNVTAVRDVSGCNILYAPKSSRSDIADLLEEASTKPVLTVTEDDLVDLGACISFVIRGTRLNFKISRSNIEQQGLKVSNALLSLGEIVE